MKVAGKGCQYRWPKYTWDDGTNAFESPVLQEMRAESLYERSPPAKGHKYESVGYKLHSFFEHAGDEGRILTRVALTAGQGP